MRLIDADKLKVYRCDDSASRATFDYIDEDDVEDAPTIDLVRCGECKWWEPVVYSNGEGGMVCVQTPLEPATEPDDFCSYGERRKKK